MRSHLQTLRDGQYLIRDIFGMHRYDKHGGAIVTENTEAGLMFEAVWGKVKDDVLRQAEQVVKEARDMSKDLPFKQRQAFLNQVNDIHDRNIELAKVQIRSFCERYYSDEQFRESVISLHKAQN